VVARKKTRELATQILFWLLGSLFLVSAAMAGAWANSQNNFRNDQVETNRSVSERLGRIEAQLLNLSAGQKDLKALLQKTLDKR